MMHQIRPMRVAHIYTHAEIQAIVQAAWQLPPATFFAAPHLRHLIRITLHHGATLR